VKRNQFIRWLQVALFLALLTLSVVLPVEILAVYRIPIILFLFTPLIGLLSWSHIEAVFACQQSNTDQQMALRSR
jgi:hypothetical protein